MTVKTLSIRSNMRKLDDSPLAMAVQKAGEFDSTIYITNGSMRANAKSLMGMLSMQVDPAEPVVITAGGPDEEAAAETLADFIQSQL